MVGLQVNLIFLLELFINFQENTYRTYLSVASHCARSRTNRECRKRLGVWTLVPDFVARLYCPLAVQPWASCFTSLFLSFSARKMGVLVAVLHRVVRIWGTDFFLNQHLHCTYYVPYTVWSTLQNSLIVCKGFRILYIVNGDRCHGR